MQTIIRGTEAIALAAALGVTLCKYADPIENAREGLTVEEATEIAREDAGLIWLSVDDEAAPDFDDAETFGREVWS
jgi:hypothetical protein